MNTHKPLVGWQERCKDDIAKAEHEAAALRARFPACKVWTKFDHYSDFEEGRFYNHMIKFEGPPDAAAAEFETLTRAYFEDRRWRIP
jgi:hypothetical protein